MKRVLVAMVASVLGGHVSGNVLYDQAKEAGVRTCLPEVEHLSDFLLDKRSDSGAHSVWNIEQPNQAPFTSAMERNFGEDMIFFNVVATPLPTGECYTEYLKVIDWPESCIAASKNYAEAEYKGLLNKRVAYLQDKNVSIYLSPSSKGSTCTIVLKEISYTEPS